MTKSNASGQNIAVSNQLMHGYSLVSPLSGRAEIRGAKDGAGAFHILSLGNDGHVYDVLQTETGWTQRDLGAPPGGAISLIDAGADASGAISVQAVQPLPGAELQYVCRIDNSTNVPQWKMYWSRSVASSNKKVASFLSPDGRLLSISNYEAQTAAGDMPELVAIDPNEPFDSNGQMIGDIVVNGPGANTVGNAINDFGIGVFSIRPALQPRGAADYRIWMTGSFSTDPSGAARANSRMTIYPNDPNANYYNAATWLPPGDVYQDVCVVPDPHTYTYEGDPNVGLMFAELSVLFVINGSDSGLYVKRWAPPVQPVGYDFPIFQDPPLVKLSGDVAIAKVCATVVGSRIEAICIGQDGYIYHVRSNDSPAFGWTDLVALDTQRAFADLLVDSDAEGRLLAYGVTRANQLHSIQRDDETTEWRIEPIELASTTLQRTESYHVALRLSDDAGLPLANAAVTLWTSSPTDAIVNGAAVRLDEDFATSATTGPDGMLDITLPAPTQDCPTLKLQAPFMAQNETVSIDPNAYIEDRLAAITAPELLNAKTLSGDPINVLGKYNNEAVAHAMAQALNQTMTLTGRSSNAAAPKYFSAVNKPRGLSHHAAGDRSFGRKIDASAVVDQHWKLEFTKDGPVFTPLDRTRAVALMAERRATRPAASGILGFDVDWGDIWNSFTDSVDAVTEVIVSTVMENGIVQSIESQVLLAIESAEHVFDGAISLVEQALDMARGILRKIGDGAASLFTWLGYVLNYDDIRRTADAFAHIVDQSLGFVSAALSELQGQADAVFDHLIGGLASTFDAAAAKLPAAATTLKQAFEATGVWGDPLPAPLSTYSPHNPLFEALRYAVSPKALSRAVKIDPSLQPILNALETAAQDLMNGRGKQAFQKALDFFAEIKTSPDQFLELSLQGLFGIVEGLALVAAESAKAVVDVLFASAQALVQALRDVLFEQQQIPLVSDIYHEITGRDLSFRWIDLVTLMVALPTTPIFKATEGVAPFPDDASLERFRAMFTSAWLLSRCGLGPTLAASADDEGILSGLRKLSIDGFTAVMSIRAVAEVQVHGTTWEEADIGPKLIGRAVLGMRLLTSLFTVPWIMKYQEVDHGGTIYPFDQSPDGADNLLWLMQTVCGPMAQAALVAGGAITAVRDGALIFWGVLHGATHIAITIYEAQQSKVDALKISENTLHYMFPQVLRFLRADALNIEDLQVVALAYGMATFGANTAITVLHGKRFPTA